MITINDIIEKLNKEQFRFAFDGDATIEVYLGILIVSIFIEFDPDKSNRPIAIQYNLVPKDELDFDIHHEVYDNYDGKEFKDLDLDTVVDGLRGIIEYSVPINKAMTRIVGHLDEIAKEIEEYEIPENVVAKMFSNKIDFY